tara:strand:+ start:1415 stop:1759 length:345 start_codon:yes stop_codon:yes gene_type:complete
MTFESAEDVWHIVDLLLKETESLNNRDGSEYDPIANAIAQIPFFACSNHLVEPKYLKLLNKYVYCKETGVPPYPGTYGEQPASWVRQFFLIKNALAKKEKLALDKARREAKRGK